MLAYSMQLVFLNLNREQDSMSFVLPDDCLYFSKDSISKAALNHKQRSKSKI